MKYTVLWRPTAERQLATLWTDAKRRDEIAAAADAIDELLRRDPENKGESRAGGERILFLSPLVVLFTVEEENRIVYVRSIGTSRRDP